MPYDTGNPVGSRSPKDLLDNSENLDELVNSPTKETHPDRLGVDRKTWHGMEVDFQQFLADSAYQPLGDYDTDGPFTVEYRNQVFIKDGEYYRAAASTTLPYTTTDWATDESKFVGVGDATLRQDLAAPGGAFLVKDAVAKVANVTELRALTGPTDGQTVNVSDTVRAGDFRRNGSDLSSTLVASTVASTSVDAGTNTITSAGHGFLLGQGVMTETAVNGLSANTVYYVVGVTTDTFQLSATYRGAVFDLTGEDSITLKRLIDPEQGVYVISDGGSLTGADGAWVRQVGQAVNYFPKIWINWFGAVGDDDGTGIGKDNSAAINAAADLYRHWVKFINPNGPGATHNPHYDQSMSLGAYPGAYYCSRSINFSTNDGKYDSGVKNVEFDLGAIIVSGAEGRAAVDICGVFNGRYNNVSVFGLPSSRPSVGVLCARTGTASPNPSAGAHNFSGMHVIGEHSVSALYEYGSEINRYDSSCYFNNKVGVCTIYETADNIEQAITSDFCTVDTTYQSSYGSVFMGPIILWSGNDELGAEGLVVIEAMSFGPKFIGCYGDMQQGAVNKRPYFVFSAGGQTGTSANIQAPSIIDSQFENDFDSLVEIRTRVNELRIQGCAMPTAATTADINVTSTGSLYAPDIQKYRGGTTLGQMEWLVDPAATVEREKLEYYALDNVTGNYVTESTLTLDGTFYELDVSDDLGIPTNVKFVDVKVETRLTGTPGGSNFFKLRGDGETVGAKEAIFQPQVDGVSLYQEAKVPVYGGKIEYSGAAGLTRARVLVRGYDL